MIPQRPLQPTQPLPPLLWDVFCKVIDNHGDLGVCWRLSSQLASLGHQVRLWVDHPEALSWMAPKGHAGVTVMPWQGADDVNLGLLDTLPRAHVWLETFGCGLPDHFVSHGRGLPTPTTHAPVWLNLEYLSAEPYVERSHLLPSPISHGAGQGLTRRFFYPGFTHRTGGLLREPDLLQRQSRFDRLQWLAHWGIELKPHERVVSLFCYEPVALPQLLEVLSGKVHTVMPTPTRLLVTHGRATAATRAALQAPALPKSMRISPYLQIEYLPVLTQNEYDQLLWASDINFVRGEDSWVRALWAGKPMVWQAYPQHDAAHHTKLDAFLDWSDAPADVRQLHQAWNGLAMGTAPPAWHLLYEQHESHQRWLEWMSQVKSRLMASEDLVTRLLRAVQADLKSAPQP